MIDNENDNDKQDNPQQATESESEQSISDLWDIDNSSNTQSENQTGQPMGFDNDRHKASLYDEEKIVPTSIIRESYTINNTEDEKNIDKFKKKFQINPEQIKNIFKKIKLKGISLSKFKKIKSESAIFNMQMATEKSHNIESNKFKKFINKWIYTYVKRWSYQYVNAPQPESRFFATALLFSGLVILGTLHYSKKIPDWMLPLTSIGMEDSGNISSSIIPITSDSSFENSGLNQNYEIITTVQKGDSFGKILTRYNINKDNRHNRLIKDVRKKFNVRKIFVGQQITFYLSGGYFKGNETKIEKIKFKINEESSVIAKWNGETLKYDVTEFKEKLTETQKQATGNITTSLYKAMEQQGVKVGAINSFINLFSFDVDFQRDIRKGDKFDIGFSEYKNKDGKYVRSGNIRYAELSVQGISKRYYKYKTASGREDYFDADGKSGRKALMKTPIEGARLSSSFGKRRHPVLGYTKLHKGTDFAAPKGTPIFAAGDGNIEYAGRNGSFGIYIRIRHNGSYKTAYAHMSGIARGIRNGKRVRQGQVIGYVGSTGRSTGNHLHYEVHKNGVAIDSRRMKLPSGKKLKGKELAKFKQFIKPMLPKN